MGTAEIIILSKKKQQEKTDRDKIEEFIKKNPDKYHVLEPVPYEYDNTTKPTPRRRSNSKKKKTK